MQTCRVRERAHKSRRAAVFSSRSGSEQGMHWSRGNGTKTCRYIKVASLHVGIRSKIRRCVVGQENIEHGHAWPAELQRKLRDCRHLSRAPRCMQPRTRLERLARNGASQPAGRGPWNLDTRPRPQGCPSPWRFHVVQSLEHAPPAVAFPPVGSHEHVTYTGAIAAATTKASRKPCITLKRRIYGCRTTVRMVYWYIPLF